MSSFTDIFVKRPVLAIVVNLVILIGGLQAISSLNVREYPKLQSATVTVTTAYVGASADLVRGFITTPLERSIAAADGIDYIESQSVQGVSTINVRLKLNADSAKALSDISARVNQVRADLPPESEIPAIKLEPSDGQRAAMYLSFRSSILDENQVTDYLIRVVQPRFSAIEGLQRADILGGRTFAVRAWLDPKRMAALHVSPSQVRQALSANNFLSAVGQTKGALVQLNLTATTDATTLEDFEQLVVRDDDNTLIRLKDVATLEMGAENYDQEVRFNGDKAVFMGIWVLPNANTLDVLNSVRAEFAAVQKELPRGMQADVAYDSSKYIQSAINDVIKTLGETIAIVIVVIFLFLGSLRSVLVPIVAIPVSLIGAVLLAQVLGFTVNLLTLLAVVLAVGLVVDDAIVVVENTERHRRLGKSAFDAAILGARELVGPVVAMTITLAAVYAPIGFQGGLTGSLFREFAFTLAGAVFISGIVALTLSPMMSSKLIKPPEQQSALAKRIDRGFDRLKESYGHALGGVLKSRRWVYAGCIFLSVLVVPMYMFAPKELAPTEDQGVLFSVLDVPANATLEQLVPYADKVQTEYESVAEYDHSFQLVFPSGGFSGIVLSPWEDRKRTVFGVQPELTKKLANIAGIKVPVFLRPALPSPGNFPVEFVVSSTAEHEEIVRYAGQLVKEAMQSGLFAFPPIIDVKIDQAKASIVLDRDKIGSMGLTMQQVGSDLSAMLGGNFVNRFNLDGRSYKVIPQIERASRLSISQLKDIHISGPDGQLIPLSAVATIEQGIEPRSLNRFQQLNAVKISGMTTTSLDAGLKLLEQKAAQILPAEYRIGYTGESRQLREESNRFLPAMGLAILLIFLVLAAQFNSFRDPLVILLGSVPLAMFGALIFTFLKFTGPPGLSYPLTQGWTTTLNIYSQVGLVTLVGLVAKNGILIVEFANHQQETGLSKLEAVHEAAMVRLRPILMTSVATVVGHFPLTLVTGAGAQARNSIGLVLVGGMAIGTLFTLFVVPAVYMLFAKDHRALAQVEHVSAEPLAGGQSEPAPSYAE